MTQAGFFLATLALAVFSYQAYLLQVALKCLLQRKEGTESVLQQMRKNSAQIRENTRVSLADTRQYQQDSHQETLRFRAENLRRADENVQRMEELLRLQREQVALLQKLIEQQPQEPKQSR